MIHFLLGAFSILAARANKIIRQLESKATLPKPVVAQCALVSTKTRQLVPGLVRRAKVIQSLSIKIAQGHLSAERAEPVLRGSFLAYRDFKRELDAIEEFFVGHISRFIEADLFLTSVAAVLWNEARLPGVPPVAVASTSGYFCTVASLGIIFSPPSVEDHLLILPDLYHEAGHLLHERLGLRLFGQRFEQALHDHEQELRNQIRRVARPMKKGIISDIVTRWERRWAEEAACDTLAARLVGPAYGWCNLHLCLQSPNVYAIGLEHPADVARTKHIFRVLKRAGWEVQVNLMENQWNQYLAIIKHNKARHFVDYHPDQLFIAVMEDVEEATRSLSVYQSGSATVSEILNEAWNQFLYDPISYEDSKAGLMNKMKEALLS